MPHYTKGDIEFMDAIVNALRKHSREVFINPAISLMTMIHPIVWNTCKAFDEHKDVHKVGNTLKCTNDRITNTDATILRISEGNTKDNCTCIIITDCFTGIQEDVYYYLPNLVLEPKETPKVYPELSDCMRSKVKKASETKLTFEETCDLDSLEYAKRLFKEILDVMSSFSLNSEVPTHYAGMTTIMTHLSSTFADESFYETYGNIKCEPNSGHSISIQIINASKRFFTIRITNSMDEAYAILPIYWKE